MYLNFIDLIILISASQSLFLSIIIYFKYGKTTANKALALLLFFYALVLAEMILTDVQFFMVSPHLMLILFGTPFLLGPLHYLYAKYLIRSSERFRLKDGVHFILFIIYLIAVSPEILKSSTGLTQDFSILQGNSIPTQFLILNWLVMIQVVVYALMIIRVVKRYSRQIKDVFSSVEKIKLNWLTYLVILLSGVIILYIIENTLITGRVISNKYMVSSVIAGVYVYIIGYLVLFKSDVYTNPAFVNQIEQLNETENESGIGSKKYLKSGLSDEAAEEHLNILIKLMEDKKPYMDSELTLNKLAELISISPHHLSEVINKKLNQNFFDFVNSYRIEKVKEDLLNPQKQNYKLLSIALDAGFNSKSSFNTIFKRQTGMTPSEFKRRFNLPGFHSNK